MLRGDGYLTIDIGLGKRFAMLFNEHHSLQIRFEAFNVTNTARFDPNSLSVNLGNRGAFGK